jgi:hypothetical protein
MVDLEMEGRALGARSVGMRGGFPLSPAAKKKPRIIDDDV